jgi:hypothetical protein
LVGVTRDLGATNRCSQLLARRRIKDLLKWPLILFSIADQNLSLPPNTDKLAPGNIGLHLSPAITSTILAADKLPLRSH